MTEARTCAAAGRSTSRPKSRTSAARTASGPPYGVGAGRPSQVSAAAEWPVSAVASTLASGSCLAYARGKPLRCTRWAATVSGSSAYPGTSTRWS